MTVDGAFGPAVAVAAGTVSFLSPCVLPLVPIYAAQMAAGASTTAAAATRRMLLLRSIAFVLGFSLVFIALGASVGLVGGLLTDHKRTMAYVAGVVLIVLGLHQSGILRIPLLYRGLGIGGPSGNPRGYAGWALIGGAVSVGWVPCVGPALGSILGLATESATVGRGAFLLACYSLGLGIPFLIVGMMAGRAGAAIRRMRRIIPVVELASGALLILAGILVFTSQFTWFNGYFNRFDIFGIGTNGGI